jgi:hypothetical protein
MRQSNFRSTQLSRRDLLAGVGGVGLAGLLGASPWKAMAATSVELPFVNGRRELVTNFPQKGAMLLASSRPMIASMYAGTWRIFPPPSTRPRSGSTFADMSDSRYR